MDTVTQIALGAVVGEAGWRHKLGGKATAVGAFCGLLPDLDVLLGQVDPWAMLAYHRGVTHSLVVIPLIALPVAWLGWRWDRKAHPYATWLHLALWGLITHTLLDWFTSYGTLLLTPLSERRFALDGVSILDPLYTLPLLAAILIGRFKKVPVATARKIAAAALAFTTAYLLLGTWQSHRAHAYAVQQLAAEAPATGFRAERVRAMPTLFNIWVFRILARDAQGNLRIGFVSTWSPKRIDFTAYQVPESTDDAALIAALRDDPRGRLFEWFSMESLSYEVVRGEGAAGPLVIATDRRFGLVTEPDQHPFHIRATFDGEGRLLNVERFPRRRTVHAGRELAALWSMIWTGRPGLAVRE